MVVCRQQRQSAVALARPGSSDRASPCLCLWPPEDYAFLALKALLEPFGITRFYTDGWGAYQRHLDPECHEVGKRNTQRLERQHLALRTRIKRLARKTICFSKSVQMHDTVVGLLINRFSFGRNV